MNRPKIRRAIIIISFLLFPIVINYFSPYIIIEATAQGIIAGSFLVFTVLFLSSLILGRAFCGWLCPAGGWQECCFYAVDKKAKGGKYNLIKYFIWVPWIGIIISLAILAGGYHKIDILFLTESGISVDRPTAYILYYTIIGGITLLALTLGKRAFCHYTCWITPFMIIGTKIKNKFKWPSLHLEADKKKCVKCKTCETGCPMSLEPWKMVENDSMTDTECILCGNCIDTCPNGVIKYSFSSPK